MSKEKIDNRSKQLNRENDLFWLSRGFTKRPKDFKTKSSKSIHHLKVKKDK